MLLNAAAGTWNNLKMKFINWSSKKDFASFPTSRMDQSDDLFIRGLPITPLETARFISKKYFKETVSPISSVTLNVIRKKHVLSH